MISQINIELTSRCDKACYFCGHQNPKVNPNLQKGDISMELLTRISRELPPDPSIIVQFHRDGEPLLYPDLSQALEKFSLFMTNIVTNGKRLNTIGQGALLDCKVLTVSAFAKDPEGVEQDASILSFMRRKTPGAPPRVFIKIVGEIEEYRRRLWDELGIPVIRRQLHVPQASRQYRGSGPPIPEHGICLDLLHHPSIDWQGNVYVCNRLDTEGRGKIGNLHEARLTEILGRRWPWIDLHLQGRRDECPPCQDCEFYGIPAS